MFGRLQELVWSVRLISTSLKAVLGMSVRGLQVILIYARSIAIVFLQYIVM